MRNAILVSALPLLFAACATGSGQGAGDSPGEPFSLGSGLLDQGPRLVACSAARAQSPDGRLNVNDPEDRRVLANGKSMRVSFEVSREGKVQRPFVTGLPGVGTDVWDVSPEDQSRAVAYVRTCQYEPALRAGQPVAVKDVVMSVFVATR
jgi:hypothetical protein